MTFFGALPGGVPLSLRSLRIENFVLIREAELRFAPGLNAVTGETGAGKTILAQAIGLLLGARGDAGYVGPGGGEAYVEAELDLPEGVLDDPELASLAELRPADEPSLVAARRVFLDGRTRAYAWGRSVPREELAALVERLLAMSGQFEQRRLARPAFQLDVLDAYCGDEQLRRRAELARAWRELVAARRRLEELQQAAAGEEARLAELEELVARTEGSRAGRRSGFAPSASASGNVTELAAAAAEAAEALVPERRAAGAAELTAGPARPWIPVAALAAELGEVERELVEAEVRVSEAASALRALPRARSRPTRPASSRSSRSSTGSPTPSGGFGGIARSTSSSSARRRRGSSSSARAAGPTRAALAETELAEAQARVDGLAAELRAERAASAPRFADDVPRRSPRSRWEAASSASTSASVRSARRAPTTSPSSSARTPGSRCPPVAETASGGELSRVALALRTVAHAGAGEPTVVFDEIDAGIGGETAHAVADALRSLGGAGPDPDDHAPARKSRARPRRTSASRRSRATRRTPGSSASPTRRAAKSSSACSAAPSSSRRSSDRGDSGAPRAEDGRVGARRPSRTTCRTGGRPTRASNPIGEASCADARWTVRRSLVAGAPAPPERRGRDRDHARRPGLELALARHRLGSRRGDQAGERGRRADAGDARTSTDPGGGSPLEGQRGLPRQSLIRLHDLCQTAASL